MTIKSIRIENMHNVKDVTYDLSQINYATGPNGCGKSTILQAVELALLGYIPGYPKKNSDIMKHANSSQMAVTLNFSNGNMIKRVYTRKKTSVSCEVITFPENWEVEDLTSELAGITFDFSSFLSKSANDQKKWFISFLSNASASNGNAIVDIDKEIDESVEVSGLDEDTNVQLQDSIRQYIPNREKESDLDYLKLLEKSVSEGLSYEKGVHQSLQNTLNTLVLYEDVKELDEEEILAKLETLQKQHDNLILQQKEAMTYELANKQLDAWKGLADCVANDPKHIEKSKAIQELKAAKSKETENLAALQATVQQKEKNRQRITTEVLTPILSSIQFNESLANGSGMCPYSKKMCEEVKSYIQDAKTALQGLNDQKIETNSSIKNLDEDIQKSRSSIAKASSNIANIETQIVSISTELSRMESMYEQREQAKRNMPNNPGISYEDALSSAQFVQTEIQKLTGELSKIRSNKQYEEVKSNIDRDMLIADLTVKALSTLKTRFGSNGLQQTVMMKPFEYVINTVSTYLQKTFNNRKISAYFTLSEKSNSFEFGLVNDKGVNIPFETLSSGEKCVYMLALQSSLVDKSNSLKVIILDDVFDHVDEGNIKRCINAARKFKSIQYMFATFNRVADLPSDINIIEVNKGDA